MTSVTRLSICPWMMTTSLGRSVPRWIATMSRMRTGVGMRAPGQHLGRIDDRQAIAACRGYRLNSPRAHSSAAPIPRLGSVCDDKVWRVPKLTRLSIVCRSCAWLTGAMIARSFASVEGGRRCPDKHQAPALRQTYASHSPLARLVSASPQFVERELRFAPAALASAA